MVRKVQLVAVVPPEMLDTFLDKETISSVEGIPDLSELVKSTVRDFMKEHVGYDNDGIACLSNLNGEPPELSKGYNQVDEVLTINTGSSLWQLAMPEDMLVSIDFQTLLELSEETEGMHANDPMAESYLEDLRDALSIGYKEGQSTVSFIPFIELKSCRVGLILDNNWSGRSIDRPGLKMLDLKKLSIFQ